MKTGAPEARLRYNSVINISTQNGRELMVAQQTRGKCTSTSPGNRQFHLITGREGSCDDALCLGINNTVSSFFCGGGFELGPSEITVCTMVEVEEVLSMPRWRRIASLLAYFLASRGNTGSIYLCVLGAVS